MKFALISALLSLGFSTATYASSIDQIDESQPIYHQVIRSGGTWTNTDANIIDSIDFKMVNGDCTKRTYHEFTDTKVHPDQTVDRTEKVEGSLCGADKTRDQLNASIGTCPSVIHQISVGNDRSSLELKSAIWRQISKPWEKTARHCRRAANAHVLARFDSPPGVGPASPRTPAP